jgi:tripartite-type tricarboxylate transporter receptor subunit TctC
VSQALADICREPAFAGTASAMGVDAIGSTPEQLAAAIGKDLPVYRAAVKAAGLLRK